MTFGRDRVASGAAPTTDRAVALVASVRRHWRLVMGAGVIVIACERVEERWRRLQGQSTGGAASRLPR